ncbi:hypothetical protein BKA59DRAFT_181861 [Fusarium tricinctum]|uniref:Uncharacterized protein n=1 Tax=Fusarium tricinctum TaxID=61284 RepID=A0A8K0WC07_9HYPO|nr:hypothetical protein BKA59DRAFT_181861 [Fusarium tricinctum]
MYAWCCAAFPLLVAPPAAYIHHFYNLFIIDQGLAHLEKDCNFTELYMWYLCLPVCSSWFGGKADEFPSVPFIYNTHPRPENDLCS